MGYTGHALDAEVGLMNANGRLYAPKLGRFLQVDPLQTDLFNSHSECHGIIVLTPPGGGDLGTAQAGSPAEEASAPAAPGALEIGAAYVEGLGPSLASAA